MRCVCVSAGRLQSTRAEQFREHAANCLKLAASAQNEQARAMLVHMAEGWIGWPRRRRKCRNRTIRVIADGGANSLRCALRRSRTTRQSNIRLAVLGIVDCSRVSFSPRAGPAVSDPNNVRSIGLRFNLGVLTMQARRVTAPGFFMIINRNPDFLDSYQIPSDSRNPVARTRQERTIHAMMKNPTHAMSPAAAARAYGIPHYVLRRLIRDGHIIAHGVARRSLILCSDIKSWLRDQPPTKVPRKSCPRR